MRIGFDAKWFFSGHPSGKVFTQNVVSRMPVQHPEHEYVLFLRDDDRARAFPKNIQPVELLYGSLGNNLVSNVFVLPELSKRAKLDLLFTQNFAIPRNHTKQITIIFDVIFRRHPEFFSLKERAYFSFIKPLLRWSDAIVTISDYSKRELIRYGYTASPENVFVLPLGVDDSYLHAGMSSADDLAAIRAKYRLPERMILYLGRLNQRKNIGNLVESMTRVEDSRAVMVLCGEEDGKMFDVDALVKNNSLEQRVTILRKVDRADIPAIYRCATLFVYPSVCEGFGLAPLEAMAVGTPAIVSGTSSMPEVCGDAVQYIDPLSVEDIAAKINTLLRDEDHRRNLSRRGVQRAKGFTWQMTVEKLLEIADTVVRGTR